MATARTANQIISDALKQAGNETISSEAQIWLNNFLDRMYEDLRWPFQEETSTGSLAQSASTANLPSDFIDFWDRNGLRLEDDDGNFVVVVPRPADMFDTLVDPSTEGTPEIALVNFADLVWSPYPRPNQAYTWHLRYKKKPARVSNFDATISPFSNDELLTQAVFVKALQFEDDDRYVQEAAILEKMIKMYKRGFNLSPTKGTRLSFQSQVFRGITPLR